MANIIRRQKWIDKLNIKYQWLLEMFDIPEGLNFPANLEPYLIVKTYELLELFVALGDGETVGGKYLEREFNTNDWGICEICEVLRQNYIPILGGNSGRWLARSSREVSEYYDRRLKTLKRQFFNLRRVRNCRKFPPRQLRLDI